MTRQTIIILLVIIVVLVAWDIHVATNGINGDTISEITLRFARKHPIISFALGFVMGHLLWPQRVKEDGGLL